MKSGKRDKSEFWKDLKIDGKSDAHKILLLLFLLVQF